jgi:hypothetical protein
VGSLRGESASRNLTRDNAARIDSFRMLLLLLLLLLLMMMMMMMMMIMMMMM